MKLDFSIKDPQARLEHAQQVLKNTPDDKKTPQYLNYIADYLLCITEKKQTKKEQLSEYQILTKNREATINKRQVSFEQVVSNLESGEDGIYALINNDKNQLLDKKSTISEEDLKQIPHIQEQYEIILKLKKQFDKAQGPQKYQLKKQIIETWQQIYLIKESFRAAANTNSSSSQLKTLARANLSEDLYIDPQGTIRSTASVNLLDQQHIIFLLCNYAQLKEDTWEDLDCDMRWLLIDLENLVEQALKDEPILYDVIVYKIDGLTNEQIQEKIKNEYGVWHDLQYYSTLWRHRIPKLLLKQSQKNYLTWYYNNQEYGEWKKCNKCGQYKVLHPLFFSKDKNSKDGYCGTCKDCKKKGS